MGMESFLLWMDPWCIAPYRWFPDLPEWGYMVGTCVLAVQAVVLGLLTLRLGQRMHAARLKELRAEMQHYHKLKMCIRDSNGGMQRFPQADWKPAVECKRKRELDCKRDISSRYESRC